MSDFVDQVISLLNTYGCVEAQNFDTPFLLLSVNHSTTLFHLIPFSQFHDKDRNLFQNISINLHQKGYKVWHLWEDRWVTQRNLVISKIDYIFGKSTRIFGRNTTLERIASEKAKKILDTTHYLGFATCRYHWGLRLDDEIVAMASFSNKRMLTYEKPIRTSYELIRFTTLPHFTVIGGLSKLIQHFIKEKTPDHIMTYFDIDFGINSSFIEVGFKLKQLTSPQQFFINEAGKRIFGNIEKKAKYNGFNAGNLKLEMLL